MKSEYLFCVKKFLTVLLFPALIIIDYGCYTQYGSKPDIPYQPPMEFNIDDLNQYGDWIELSDFGEVWKPSVIEDWQPFYYGHWVYTDDGWTWISYEPFGWVVYHYGYWYYDSNYEWVWIPQDDGWSPAVVQWSKYDDYISWAPLPPEGVSYGEPWEEKTPFYWHNIDPDSFMDDNVGKFEKGPPPKHDGMDKNDGKPGKDEKDLVKDDGKDNNKNDNKPSNTENKIKTRTDTGTQSTAARDNRGSRNSSESAPTRDEIKSRTGKEVTKTTVTKEKSTSKSNLNKVSLPAKEKERVTKNSETVKKEVIVPKSSSTSKKSTSSKSKDDSSSKQKTKSRSR